MATICKPKVSRIVCITQWPLPRWRFHFHGVPGDRTIVLFGPFYSTRVLSTRTHAATPALSFSSILPPKDTTVVNFDRFFKLICVLYDVRFGLVVCKRMYLMFWIKITLVFKDWPYTHPLRPPNVYRTQTTLDNTQSLYFPYYTLCM